MARAKKTPAPEVVEVLAEESTPTSPAVIVDRRFESEDGTSIHLYCELRDAETTIRIYRDLLLKARRVVTDGAVPTGDELIGVAALTLYPEVDFTAKMAEDKKQEMYDNIDALVLAHYAQLAQDVQEDAVLLTLTRTNVFEFEVTPWPENTSASLPGTLEFPAVTRNLVHPTERRLRQFYQYMESHEDATLALMAALPSIMTELNLTLSALDVSRFQS